MDPNHKFTTGDWVTAEDFSYGSGDGIADELSVNRAYLVVGVYKNGCLKLLNFIGMVDPQCVRMSTAREKVIVKEKYDYLDLPKET